MRKELIGIILVFLVLFTLISLLSYSPADPSINHAMAAHKINNLFGFVGAHLASLEWSLEEVAKRLDKFPNMSVDLSRMSNIELHALRNREKTRDFFIKYQDRLLYATDSSINPTKDPERLKNNMHNRWLREWKFYVTDDKITLRGFGELNGLKLPREVIDKIYLTNALKILKMPR